MRTTKEIYEALKQDFYEACGISLREGGDMALRLLAAAAELFTLEAQCDYVRRQAFPQTAEGQQLDLHAASRAISRRGEVKATGELCFSLSGAAAAAVSIPVGTECLDGAGRVYVTVEEGIIPVGQLSCTVAARAGAEGEEGNVPAGTVTHFRYAPAGVTSVANPGAFTGGIDCESDESLRSRVLASYRKLPNGANVAYYESLALSHPNVEKVVVLPRARGRGTVDIVFSSAAGMPDAELIESVSELIGGSREICVDVELRAPQARNVDLIVSVTPQSGWDFETVRSRVDSAIRQQFHGGKLGEGIYIAGLYAMIMAVEGVANCIVSSPAADISVDATTLPVLSSLSITEGV